MHGADGEDCLVHIPLGTLVYDKISGELIVDIDRDGQRFIVAPGGRGGLGNEHFKSSTNQTPREATPGQPGVERTLRLELKLIADVGLIGKPNAGKSTLLRSVSRANPKVASYPFTTLTPHLGIAQLPAARRSGDRKGGERRLVIADIPGLIDGAAEGAGLGHDFLRHVERTRLLVHVLDVQPMDGSDPRANYEAIRRELFEYSPAMAEKPEIVALNKIDLVPEPERDEVIGHLLRQLDLPPDEPPVRTSGATGDGLADLLETCWQRLDKSPAGWTAGEQRSDTA
jgi:GTP-binding protein